MDRYDFGRGSRHRSARIPLDYCTRCNTTIALAEEREVIDGKDYHKDCAELERLEAKIRGARMTH